MKTRCILRSWNSICKN